MLKFKHKKYSTSLILTAFFLSFFYWIFIATKNPLQSIDPILTPSETSSSLPIIFGTARVIDGDTIEINKKRIRLLKIDAPESKQKCLDKNYIEYLCGEMSTAFLKKMIDGKKVECNSGEKDIYKRYLGNCKLGDININYEMVRGGMAIIYNLKDADEKLKSFEMEAKNNKLGVWQGAFEEPKQYRKKHRHKK